MARFRLFSTVAVFLVLASVGASAQAAPAQASLGKGWEAYNSGDYQAAFAVARDTLRTAPGDLANVELFARASLAMGDGGSAFGALNMLCGKRGTLADYQLLLTATEMTGRYSELEKVLERAEKATSPSAEGLYALAWQRGDAAGRTRLLKRIAADYPAQAPALAPEIAFWEARGESALKVVSPLPAAGAVLSLKTLYDMEWVTCKTAAGEDMWLMVDMAARETVLSKESAEKLGLRVIQGSFPPDGAYPQEKSQSYSVLDKLDFGHIQISNIPVLMAEDKTKILAFRDGRSVLKGILGMDLLRGMKVRFDRQKNQLLLYSKETPVATLLDGDPGSWKETPAFSAANQVFVRSAVGKKTPVAGLLATGCSLVLLPEGALAGTGAIPDSKKVINLMPMGELELDQDKTPIGFTQTGLSSAHSSVGQSRSQVMGWFDLALPMVGKVRTIPKATDIGFGNAGFQINDLPLYPGSLGGRIPVGIVIGTKISNFFALALDLNSGKLYFKQTLFAK